MPHRAMTGFRLDDDGDWVAELECGHTQHVRHRPPWQERPWVTTPEGRAAKVGQALDCSYCEMPTPPPEVRPYRRTPTFDEETVPRALTKEHDTRAGVWGRIVVETGRLRYVITRPTPREWVLRPGVDGHIAPETPHRVEPLGPVRFHLELSKADE